jgi:AraC-like DNA-binding protein
MAPKRGRLSDKLPHARNGKRVAFCVNHAKRLTNSARAWLGYNRRMNAPEQAFTVRSGYMYELAGACQRFVGSSLHMEPDAFPDAVQRLAAETPVAESRVEDVVGWNLLAAAVSRGAAAHHRWFHRCFGGGRCTFHPDALPHAESYERNCALPILVTWAHDYAVRFGRTHAWPVAVRAAAVLRSRPGADWPIERLAATVGASTATLERSFSAVYGVSPHRYRSLLRMRLTAMSIRDGGCIEGVLLDLGCRSPKAVYRAFRRAAKMTIADVRRLSDDEFSSLLEGPLALPLPVPSREPGQPT